LRLNRRYPERDLPTWFHFAEKYVSQEIAASVSLRGMNDGVHATGVVRGAQIPGTLQIDFHQEGYKISAGFSGNSGL